MYKILKVKKNQKNADAAEISATKTYVSFSRGLLAKWGIKPFARVTFFADDDGHLCFQPCSPGEVKSYSLAASRTPAGGLQVKTMGLLSICPRGRYSVTGKDGDIYLTDMVIAVTML